MSFQWIAKYNIVKDETSMNCEGAAKGVNVIGNQSCNTLERFVSPAPKERENKGGYTDVSSDLKA